MDYSILSAAELAQCCADAGDAAAWEEFFHRFHRLIASVVMRTARRWGRNFTTVVDDAIQEIYLKLCRDNCRLLREFKPTHPDSIFGYLKVVAANSASDYFKSIERKHGHAHEGPEVLETVENSSGHGSPSMSERHILIKEIDVCLKKTLPASSCERDSRIFWLHYRAGMSARAIAELPSINLTTKGVESTLLRLIRMVRQELGGPAARGI